MKRTYIKLKVRMIEMGVTQKDLENIMNRSHTYITQRMNGRAPFDTSDMETIGKCLEIPQSEWLDYFYDEQSQFLKKSER